MDMKSTECIDKATAEAPAAPTPPIKYGPHNLSALQSGTLSCRHYHHLHSQLPCNLSTPNSATQTPWDSDHHHHPHLHPSCPLPPHFNPHSHSMPVHIIETVHHPKGIAPMKPIIHTTSPACHNAPYAPIQLVKTTHHPQEMRTPNRYPPRLLPLPTHPTFAIHCHCGTTLQICQE